jgi:archaellum component FlaC
MNDELAKEIRRFNVLMEDQNGKLDAILEGQKDQATRADIDRVGQRLDALESDVKVIQAAVTATNSDLKQHKSLPAHAAHGRA